MKNIIARYYYAPICTESFASFQRLSSFFSKLEDQSYFCAYDISQVRVSVDASYKSNEKDFIEGLYANKKLLKYGKLFINDIEIKGFPPSPKHIKTILDDLSINGDFDLLNSPYGSAKRTRENYDHKRFTSKIIDQDTSNDLCLLCTKYNPFLKDSHYCEREWAYAEKSKEKFIRKSIESKNIIAFVEYNNEIPVGFIEGYPSDLAARYGFVVHSLKDACMITCLHIRQEARTYNLSRKLIKRFLEQARNMNYKSVEVIAYPDDANWQPRTLFIKMGFTQVAHVDHVFLMKIDL